MNLSIGIPKEISPNETRVAATPDVIKKWKKKGLTIQVEKLAGANAGFQDSEFQEAGAEIVNTSTAFQCNIVIKVSPPQQNEWNYFRKGALLTSFLDPLGSEYVVTKLKQHHVDAIAMELIPRTSRAQSMDALSSQANIAGYRAVLEAATQFGGFFPMMMTAAGSTKPAKVIVLGAGVAGLQAIGTSKRLGAVVEAFDVRPEVKEQIESLGAKFIDIRLDETGSGTGGYAKELSEEGKRKLQEELGVRLKKADILISTANIPGKKAPILISESTVSGMRPGSIIVDMAAASGGNCPLSEANQVVVKHGVKIVGITNFPALLPHDASAFYSRNLFNLLELVLNASAMDHVKLPLEDDIIQASLLVFQGEIRNGPYRDNK